MAGKGGQCPKAPKNTAENSLKKEMLESLLHIAINGPPVKESEAVINKAVELWKEKKKRKKLSRSCLQQPNAQNAQNNQDEVEEGEEEGGGSGTQEVESMPSSDQGEPSCSTREQEEELEEELAKELDLSLSSDSAFESDMDD